MWISLQGEKLSEKFIAKFNNYLDWHYISISQNLSEKFISTEYWSIEALLKKIDKETEFLLIAMIWL